MKVPSDQYIVQQQHMLLLLLLLRMLATSAAVVSRGLTKRKQVNARRVLDQGWQTFRQQNPVDVSKGQLNTTW